MKTVVIIPALNEEEAIGDVVHAVPRHSISEIIVVDNGSTDATAERAFEAGARVIPQPERGYGAACDAGVRAANDADAYVFLDGDGSDPPESLPTLVGALSGAGLVLGVRRGHVENGSMLWHQRAGNIFMSRLISRLTGQQIHDLPSFKAIDGSLMRALALESRTHGWTAELITKAACRGTTITEVETGYRRRRGKSKVSGSVRGSVLAAYRMNAAILQTWSRERRR